MGKLSKDEMCALVDRFVEAYKNQHDYDCVPKGNALRVDRDSGRG